MSKSLVALERIKKLSCVWDVDNDEFRDVEEIVPNAVKTIEKELKALEILIKWYQPDIIHDLCCFGASDEEIALVKEILNEHR